MIQDPVRFLSYFGCMALTAITLWLLLEDLILGLYLAFKDALEKDRLELDRELGKRHSPRDD